MAGLDRFAADISMIVEYGEPLTLKRQPGIDLERIVREVAVSLNSRPPVSGALTGAIVVDAEPGPFMGDFDAVSLAGALKSISLGAMKIVTGEKT